MASKLFIKGKQLSGAVANALKINCKDKDGNKSTVQAELNKLNNDVSEQNKNFEIEVLENVLTAVNSVTLSDVRVIKVGKIVFAEFVASWGNTSTDIDVAFVDDSIIPVFQTFGTAYVKDSGSYYMGVVEGKSTNVISIKMTKATTAAIVRAQWIIN